MELRFNLCIQPRHITVAGVSVLLLIIAFACLMHWMAPSLDAPRAEQEIRSYLMRQMMLQHQEALQAKGLTVPTWEIATAWKEDLDRLARLTIQSLEIRRFKFIPPLTSSRIFVVRVAMTDENAGRQTRYFSLSSDDRFFTSFWVNEHSRLMWLLSL